MKKHTGLSPLEILQYIPQQKPFRFVDTIDTVSETVISGSYYFSASEYFYAGHFPGKAVTPGVILLECMAQFGVVALGIYLLSLELSEEEIANYLTFFTDAEVEFFKAVYPGTRVTVKAEKQFWRKMKLRSKIEMLDEEGNLICTATASGVGVKR